MLKKLILLLVLVFVNVPAFAQSVDTTWVRSYGNGSAHGIAVDRFSNVLVTGVTYTDDYFLVTDYKTVKYYPNGDTAWVRRYNWSANYENRANAIAVDGSGNVYVTGYSWDSLVSGTYWDYATIKYYRNGDIAWVRRYNGAGSDYPNDYAYAIVVDSSGNVYVSGASVGSGTDEDYATIKYVQFLRGDVNEDDKVSLLDIVYLINYLFKFGPAPELIQSGDANCDGKVSLSDIVYLINYLFKFGPAPCS
jgi:hypothetical protein